MELFDYLTSYPVLYAVAAAMIGLIIGSFLNVVIYRLPKMMETEWRQQCYEYLGQTDPVEEKRETLEKTEKTARFDLLLPGSHCPNCQQAIPFWRNIPLLSFALQKGQCAACGSKISLRYPLVELLTAVLTVVVALEFGVSWQALAGCFLTWVLITLSLIDYDTQLLPDSITLPMIWLGLLLSLIPLFAETEASLFGAVFGYMLLWLVYYLFKILTGKEGMGFGDFKLLALLGAWLGWQMLPAIILLASVAGAVIGVSLMIFKGHDKEKPIPFGPYLAIAGWLAFMFGETLNQHYLNLTF